MSFWEEPVLAVTGHRPDKIGGYDWFAPKRVWIRTRMVEILKRIKPQYCISGMALGVDQDFALVCANMGIPFIAVIPFEGQEFNWPKQAQDNYHVLLSGAYCKFIISPGGYAAWKMQKRNEWMVDNSDRLLAVWDGSDGGTGNCVRYKQQTRKGFIDRINPNDYYEDRAA